MAHILISVGPIPARIDSVKYITNRFKGGLALKVAERGGTLPSVLNAANEMAVTAFLQQGIKFSQIYDIVERVVSKHRLTTNPKLEDVLAADRWARQEARKYGAV